MRTYSFWGYYETFGGMPEPGETYPDDPDALRDDYEGCLAERHPEWSGDLSTSLKYQMLDETEGRG